MTRKRRAVFDALERAEGPVSAADLARDLGEDLNLATVYRALHGLEEAGLAEAFAFECRERGIERYYLPQRRVHRHYFHCEQCHRFTDLGGCGVESLVRDAETRFGLRVQAHTLYMTGLCAACAEGAVPVAESGAARAATTLDPTCGPSA